MLASPAYSSFLFCIHQLQPVPHPARLGNEGDESLAETCGNPQTDDNSCLLGSNSIRCCLFSWLAVASTCKQRGVTRWRSGVLFVCFLLPTRCWTRCTRPPCVVAHSYRRALPDSTAQRVLGWATSLGGAARCCCLNSGRKEAIDSSRGEQTNLRDKHDCRLDFVSLGFFVFSEKTFPPVYL